MKKYNYLEITIEYIYKANFNDSYYLETNYIKLDDFAKDELLWINPYNGRSKRNDTLIAIKHFLMKSILF